MAGFEHSLEYYDVGDLLDDIASADPPAYLRRCCAEGLSAPRLSWTRARQLAACAKLEDVALMALSRVLEHDRPQDPEAFGELEVLVARLSGA